MKASSILRVYVNIIGWYIPTWHCFIQNLFSYTFEYNIFIGLKTGNYDH